MNKMMTIAGAVLLAVAADAANYQYNAKSWWSWQRKDCVGLFEAKAPSEDHPRGVLEFKPATGNYHLMLYTHIQAEPGTNYEYEVTFESSADASPEALVSISLGAKDGKMNRLTAKGMPSASLKLRPGTRQKATLEGRLSDYGLTDGKYAVFNFSVTRLQQGFIRITDLAVREADRKESAGEKVPAAPTGYQAGELLPRSQWPSPVKIPKMARNLEHLPLNLVYFTLDSAGSEAGMIWPDGEYLLVEKNENAFSVGKNGKNVTAVPGKQGEVIFYGTGLILMVDGKKAADVPGGDSAAGVRLLVKNGGPVPKLHNVEIMREYLAIRFLEEGELLLEKAAELLRTNEKTIREAAAPKGYIYDRWLAVNRIFADGIQKRRNELLARSGGRLAPVMENTSLRDRYNVPMSFTDTFMLTTGYMGDFFQKEFFQYFTGQGEYLAAMEHYRKAERLAERARRLQQTAFREGVAVKIGTQEVLAAGLADALEYVPRQAAFTGKWNQEWSLEAARGEQESFQLILAVGDEPVKQVGIKAVDMQGPGRLPEDFLKAFRVHFVRLTEPFSIKIPPAGGGDEYFPDILEPLKTGQLIDLPARRNSVIWLTGRIPVEAKPGIYRFKLELSIDGKAAAALPVTMKVFQFALEKNRLQSSAGIRSSAFPSFYGKELADQARRNMIRTLREHWMEPTEIYAVSPLPADLDMPEVKEMALVSAGQFNALAAPRPEMADFIRLYGSRDGRNFTPVEGKAELVPTGDPELADYDLVLKVSGSTREYSYLKIHQDETRDWHRRCPFSYFLLDTRGKPVIINEEIPAEEITYHIQDLAPATGSGREFSETGYFAFDSLRDESNRTSVVFRKPAASEIQSIRLKNSNRAVHCSSLEKNYRQFRAKLRPETEIFVYGYDEVRAHLNGQLLSALKTAKKLLPGVMTISTASEIQRTPEIFQYLDISCLTPGDLYDREIMKNGNHRYWMYVGGGHYYPFPNFERVDQPRIHSRAFFWPMIRFDLPGWLYWDIHMWRFNTKLPRQWPEIWEHWNTTWSENDSGMGALFYPGPDGEIYPSARAQVMRDGIEDFNYFKLADDLLNNRRFASAEELDRNKNTIEQMRRELSPGTSGFLQSSERLRELRRQLGELLEQMYQLPVKEGESAK